MAISALIDPSRLSHAYLICAPSREESLAAARDIAAAALCTGVKPPCGQCRACRKVQSLVHPDVITLGREADDKGKLKKEIAVEQIRRLITDACVLPNEANRKIYIIDQADTMNIAAQNAALKLLEEPPRGVVFLLCAVNAQLLLPTVRSRCVELNLSGKEEELDADMLKLAAAYLKAVAAGSRAGLYRWCAENDSMDSRAAASFIESADAAVADALLGRHGGLTLSPAQLMTLHELLSRCAAYLKVNTGVKHIFGLLAVDSIPAAETEDN